jgi:glycerophosphoryl diester phosphodiesterase
MKITPFFLFLITFSFFSACSGTWKKKTPAGDHPGPLIIAHRGGADLAPENTLAAFRNAIALGADMIEIDVHLTKDGRVVVIHDNTVDRTTGGHGRIADLTLAKIKQLDAGKKFDEKFAGEKVPTLEETMETLDGKVQLLIEIKKDHDTLYPGLEEKVVKIIHQYDAGKWVVVQSFNKHSVEKVQKADPSLRTFYLLGHNFPAFYDSLAVSLRQGKTLSPSFTGIAPHYSVLDAGKVDTLHTAGYLVYAWTVKPAEMERLIAMHVDGIITNDPDTLIALLKK